MKKAVVAIGFLAAAALGYQLHSVTAYIKGPVMSQLRGMDRLREIERQVDEIARKIQLCQTKAEMHAFEQSVHSQVEDIKMTMSGLSRLIALGSAEGNDGTSGVVTESAAKKGLFVSQKSIAEFCLVKAEQKLGEGGEECLPICSLVLQRAARALSRACAIDKEFVPDDEREVLNELARRLALAETRYNRLKSEIRVKEFDECVNKALEVRVSEIKKDMPPNKEYTLAIAEMSKHLDSGRRILPLVYDGMMRNNCEAKYEQAIKRVQEMQGERYKRYQEYAIASCGDAIEKYREYDKGVSVTVDEAKKIVIYLCDINESLLAPEVARVYHGILGKCLERLKDERQAAEMELAKRKKKTLEDF